MKKREGGMGAKCREVDGKKEDHRQAKAAPKFVTSQTHTQLAQPRQSECESERIRVVDGAPNR